MVLLFGSEMWVLTPHMECTLGGLQHRVEHRLAGKQLQRLPDTGWEYPPLGEAMREAGFYEVKKYITRSNNTVQ